MFIRPLRSENSPAKFCSFPERALPFHDNPPVTSQYSLATPILNENPEVVGSIPPWERREFQF